MCRREPRIDPYAIRINRIAMILTRYRLPPLWARQRATRSERACELYQGLMQDGDIGDRFAYPYEGDDARTNTDPETCRDDQRADQTKDALSEERHPERHRP